jgi:hypothetical protein
METDGLFEADEKSCSTIAGGSVGECAEVHTVGNFALSSRLSKGINISDETCIGLVVTDTITVQFGRVLHFGCSGGGDNLSDREATWHHQTVLECSLQIVLRGGLLQSPHGLLVA